MKKAKVKHLYEPKDRKIKYVKPSTLHLYLPDFILTTNAGKEIIVETKGIWDYADRVKHALIQRQYPDLDIRFVFTRSSARIRKGSKTTYADICNGLGRDLLKGCTWKYADELIPQEWLDE